MDNRKNMREGAEAIILADEMRKKIFENLTYLRKFW